jgi:hypothetical protein
MIDHEGRRSHWDELAEQLGLEPEKPTQSASETAAVPDPAPFRAEEEPPAQVANSYEDLEASFGQDQRQAVPTPVQALDESGDSLPEPDAELPQIDDESERSEGSKGRGRRRRRRRSKAAEENAAPEPTETGTENGAENEDEAPRRRSRRGRGRRRADEDERSSRRKDAADDAEHAPASTSPFAEEDDEMDDLSNWQAPSWQELIASLYRPDR